MVCELSQIPNNRFLRVVFPSVRRIRSALLICCQSLRVREGVHEQEITMSAFRRSRLLLCREQTLHYAELARDM